MSAKPSCFSEKKKNSICKLNLQKYDPIDSQSPISQISPERENDFLIFRECRSTLCLWQGPMLDLNLNSSTCDSQASSLRFLLSTFQRTFKKITMKELSATS